MRRHRRFMQLTASSRHRDRGSPAPRAISGSTSAGSSMRTPLMPTASAIRAKFGFRSVPVVEAGRFLLELDEAGGRR